MILVCNPFNWGLAHVQVNAAMLEVVRLAFPSEEVAFYGEESHLRHVRTQLRPEVSLSIQWKVIHLPAMHAQFFERWRSDFELLRHLLAKAGETSDGHVLLTGASNAMIMALKLNLFFLGPRCRRVQVVFHGDLSGLNGWRSRNPFLRFQDIRTALTFGRDRRVQFVVLEEPIRKAVVRILPKLEKHVFVLDLPIPTNEEPKEELEFTPPFRFGFLGLASEEKGFGLFLEVASVLSQEFPGRLEFHAIGWTSKSWDVTKTNRLTSQPSPRRLSRAEFISGIQKVHFVCLPYEKAHYEFSASGVLLDAIAWEKPFIASPVPFIEHLVARYGNIGYLCSDMQVFCTTIQRIISEADSNRYRSQVLGLRRARAARSPESLALAYRRLCGNLAVT